MMNFQFNHYHKKNTEKNSQCIGQHNDDDDGQPTHTDSFLYILLAFEYKCTIFLIYTTTTTTTARSICKKKIHSQINTTTNF